MVSFANNVVWRPPLFAVNVVSKLPCLQFEVFMFAVRYTYILICAASVYRALVQEEGWLMQLANLVKRLEHQQCSEERQQRALEELCSRFLAEESVNHNNKRVLGQHNLVRSVASEHYKQLLKSSKSEAKSA